MRASRLFLIVATLQLFATAAVADLPAALVKYADVIFVNGSVLTVNSEFDIAEAIAVRDGRVLAVGTTNSILQLAGPATTRIDLDGRSVTPGYIYNDGDNSVPGGDIYKDTMVAGELSGRITGASLPELLASIEAVLKKADAQEPVFINMPKAHPRAAEQWSADDLDEIAPSNPIALFYNDSVVVVNHAMLDMAFAAGLPARHFGVVIGPDGEPTGQLFQQAAGFIGWQLRPWPSPEYIERAVQQTKASLLGYNSVGVTTTTGHMSGLTISILNELFRRGELWTRVYPGHDFTRQNVYAEQYLRRVGNLVNFSLHDPLQGPMVKIVGAATGPVDDGSNSQFGMLTIDEKAQIDPEIGGTPRGMNKWTGEVWTGLTWDDMPEQLKVQTDYNTVGLLLRYGWNMSGNHNMGSAALRINLTAIDDFLSSNTQPYFRSQKPNAFDHNLVWHESNYPLIDKYKDSVAMALSQEIFDQRISVSGRELLEAQYGERMHTMQPVKDLLARGYHLHLEGTSPQEHPMWKIERFVTRVDDKGRTWGADQAIDRRTALRMLTSNAAWFIGEQDELGSLEPGKWADLVVLDGNYMEVASDEIDMLDIDLTYVGGRLVYDAALWH